MSKLISLIRRAPKRFSATALMVAAAIIVPAVVSAWGPDRDLYTVANPADKITFNSITDNPVAGDETNFVVVKDASNTNDGGWTDNMTVQPGKEYLVRMYVHNNAASSLNLTATNTRVSASVPTTVGKNVSVSGFVSADNSDPLRVWDDIHFNGSENFSLAYVPGSATIYNNGYADGGASLPDSIVTSSGALVGYNGPDGKVPGCFEYSNWVYFKIKPQFAPTSKFEMSKKVSQHGKNAWTENYEAQPGEVVDFLINYRNIGEASQDDVTFRDTLPTGLSYVPGSTTYTNGSNPDGVKASDNLTNGVGINLGSYASGANAWVIFSAKVKENDSLPQCGENSLLNVAKVTTGGGSINDDATVVVDKECDTPEVPPELPKTGPVDSIVAVLGLGTLVASIAYYAASRRALS